MYYLRNIFFISCILTIYTPSFAVSTLDLTQGVTPARLVNELIENSVENSFISNIRYRGTNRAAGLFRDGLTDGLNIDRGIMLSSGRISNAIGPNQCYKTTTVNYQSGDNALSAMGGKTFDAAVLEFTFLVPDHVEKIRFKYVFASEEYMEWVGSKFNDIFGFFLNGRNIALVPGTSTAVAINSINKWRNSSLFRDNNYPYPSTRTEYNEAPCHPRYRTRYNTEFDGFTTVLTAQSNVVPGRSYHIKLVIADRMDYSLDSTVFIEKGSFTFLMPPKATTLISPKKTIHQKKPTYTWEAVSNATHYQVRIQNDQDLILNQTYNTSEVHCASGTGICSVTPDIQLAEGLAQWSVLTLNENIKGDWSETMAFTVRLRPLQPTLISPTGTLNEKIPSHMWHAVSNASQYLLQINSVSGPVFSQWYSAEAAGCAEGTGICSITPEVELTQGFQWWIQAANSYGKGLLSDSLFFTIEPPLITVCQLYAVDDQGLNQSQFLFIDSETKTIRELGQPYPHYNIEALDAQLITQQLYAAAGKSAQQAGMLYQFDPANGSLTPVDYLYDEDQNLIDVISGLSFNPETNKLWLWAQGKGLLRIDIDQLPQTHAQLKWASTEPIGDITWNDTGTQLYLAKQNEILRYNGKTSHSFCLLSRDQKIEALEIISEEVLLIGIHGENTIYQMNLKAISEEKSCPIQPLDLPQMDYTDIEGMTWVCRLVDPADKEQ